MPTLPLANLVLSFTFSYAEPNGAALPLCLACDLGSIFSSCFFLPTIFNIFSANANYDELAYDFHFNGINGEKINLEELEMDLIDFGLIEFEITDKYCTIISEFEKFGEMQSKLSEISVETKDLILIIIRNVIVPTIVHDIFQTLLYQIKHMNF